jgi:hypothetical protein
MATEMEEQIICQCGCTELETLDDASLACAECGRVLEQDAFVSGVPIFDPGEKPSFNVVPEDDSGVALVAPKYQRRTRTHNLQNQAANKGRKLELSSEATQRAQEILAESRNHGRATDDVAVAAALFLGARFEGFPITLKSICLSLGAPLEDVRRAVILHQGKLDACAPSINVCLLVSLLPSTPIVLHKIQTVHKTLERYRRTQTLFSTRPPLLTRPIGRAHPHSTHAPHP